MDNSDVFETFIDPSLVDASMNVAPSENSTLLGSPSNSSTASPQGGMNPEDALNFWMSENGAAFETPTGSPSRLPELSEVPTAVNPSNLGVNQPLMDCLNDPQQFNSILTTLFPSGTVPPVTPNDLAYFLSNNSIPGAQLSAKPKELGTPVAAAAATTPAAVSKTPVTRNLNNNKQVKSESMDIDTPVQKKTVRKSSVSASKPVARKTAAPVAKPPVPPSSSAAAAASKSPSQDNDDELEGIDIKSLSSKERRQLRNKISARNFRVRRKEYIGNLEGQVKQYQDENAQLVSELSRIKGENVQLREELQNLRKQLESMSLTAGKPALKTAATRSPASASAEVSRPTSPIVRFRPNKDVSSSASGSKTASGQWSTSKNTVITVQTVLLPETQPAPIVASPAAPSALPQLDQLLGRAPIQVPSVEAIVTFYAALTDIVRTQCAWESSPLQPPASPLVSVFA